MKLGASNGFRSHRGPHVRTLFLYGKDGRSRSTAQFVCAPKILVWQQ